MFSVDASRAGAGNLELIVSVAGENVPNFVKAEGNARFEVSFTPHTPDTHMISVKFNGEVVPGKISQSRINQSMHALRFSSHPHISQSRSMNKLVQVV